MSGENEETAEQSIIIDDNVKIILDDISMKFVGKVLLVQLLIFLMFLFIFIGLSFFAAYLSKPGSCGVISSSSRKKSRK